MAALGKLLQINFDGSLSDIIHVVIHITIKHGPIFNSFRSAINHFHYTGVQTPIVYLRGNINTPTLEPSTSIDNMSDEQRSNTAREGEAQGEEIIPLQRCPHLSIKYTPEKG